MEPPDLLRRTPFEQGEARVGRVATAGPSVQQMTWLMTAAQVEIFRSWWAHEAKDGAARFVIPMWTGERYAGHEARALARWRAGAASSGLFAVTMPLEIRALALFSTYSVEDSETATSRIDRFINVTLPLENPWS